MGDTFTVSMSKTMKNFNEKVLPILKAHNSKCRYVSIEGRANDEITKDFDILAGIDAYRADVGEMRGIASRIQFTKKGYPSFDTFSVRASRDSGALTEYAKRKHAIKTGALYPYYTLQAYIGDSETVVGICKTKDLLDYIDKYNPPMRHTGASQIGGAGFYVCKWAEMKEKGYPVLILKGAA